MRRLMIFSLAFCAACALGVLCAVAPLPAVGLAAGTVLSGVLAVRLMGKRAGRALICALGLCAGLLWSAGYRLLFCVNAESFDGRTVQLDALALDAPAQTKHGVGVLAQVRLGSRRYRVMLYLDNTAAGILPGDHIHTTAELKLTPQRPSEDENLYFRSRGVWFTAAVRGAYQIRCPAVRTLRHWPALFALRLQRKIAEVFDGSGAAGFLTALMTGDRAGLDFSTRNALSLAGIYHTVAVSGMHVSILLGMLTAICGPRRRLAAGIGIPLILFFVLMTGSSASASRAGCMYLLLLLAPLVRRENDPPTSLSVALTLLLAADPWSVYNVGLQLSFAAAGGVMLFAQRIREPVAKSGWYQKICVRAKWLRWLPETMLTSFACSLASMAFSLPLSAVYFGTVSLVSPLVNVLTLWAVTLCFSAGVPVLLTALIWAPSALGLGWLLSRLADYVLWTARLFAKLPFAAVYLENAYLTAWGVMLWAALLFWLFAPEKPKLLPSLACTAAGLLAAMLLSWADFHLPRFTFTALDVGQGQCLIYGCGNWTAVVDCGGSNPQQAGEDAARFLLSAGEGRIDALILTHYDADHAGGAAQLLRRVQVDTLLIPDTENDPVLRRELIQAAEARGTAVQLVSEDCLLPFDGGSMTVFAPVLDGGSNEAGICVLASAADYDILITGDLPVEAEYVLLQTHPELGEAELLVAGHHGSRTSTGYALLNRIQPLTVVISVGENSYGHPADETLERIEKFAAAVWRTDECGTIMIRG